MYLYASGNLRIICTPVLQKMLCCCLVRQNHIEIPQGEEGAGVVDEVSNPVARAGHGSQSSGPPSPARKSVTARLRSAISPGLKEIPDKFVTFDETTITTNRGEDMSKALKHFGLKFEYKLRGFHGRNHVGIFVTAVDLLDDGDYENLCKIEVGQQVSGVYDGHVTEKSFDPASVMGVRLKDDFAREYSVGGIDSITTNSIQAAAAEARPYGGIRSLEPIHPSMELLLKALRAETEGTKAFKRPFSLRLTPVERKNELGLFWFMLRVILQGGFVLPPLAFITLSCIDSLELFMPFALALMILLLDLVMLLNRFRKESGLCIRAAGDLSVAGKQDGKKSVSPSNIINQLARMVKAVLGTTFWWSFFFRVEPIIKHVDGAGQLLWFANATTMVRQTGAAMVLLLFVRELSESLYKHWEKMALAFNNKRNIQARKFLLMEFVSRAHFCCLFFACALLLND